ncbi:MAG: response regulator transcription factor [Dehalococcoidales bacterium]|nr:response regulator transcription factor [Dehalococcoidales bacterium]
MNKRKILVVDDEPNIVRYLRMVLKDNGYDIVTATDGADAMEKLEKEMPDLIILDIIMPGLDGFEVCHRIRQWSPVPIIMVSAKAKEEDKTRCLDMGADDYITKPFGTAELVSRVKAVLRRVQNLGEAVTPATFTSGDLTINFAQRLVTIKEKPVNLTSTEFNLLQELTCNAGKVLTHPHLLNKVWGPEYHDEKQYLHVFIGRLRLKIEKDPANPEFIVTIPGVGYKFTSEK